VAPSRKRKKRATRRKKGSQIKKVLRGKSETERNTIVLLWTGAVNRDHPEATLVKKLFGSKKRKKGQACKKPKRKEKKYFDLAPSRGQKTKRKEIRKNRRPRSQYCV